MDNLGLTCNDTKEKWYGRLPREADAKVKKDE